MHRRQQNQGKAIRMAFKWFLDTQRRASEPDTKCNTYIED